MPQIWFLDYFSKSVSSKSELESSLRSFSASHSIFNLTGSGQKKENTVRGVGGGGAGDYSREAINQGAAIIRGNTLCAL